jgi:hypothetical protein
MVPVTAADPGDLAAIQALLRECGLPSLDLTVRHLRRFLVVRSG